MINELITVSNIVKGFGITTEETNTQIQPYKNKEKSTAYVLIHPDGSFEFEYRDMSEFYNWKKNNFNMFPQLNLHKRFNSEGRPKFEKNKIKTKIVEELGKDAPEAMLVLKNRIDAIDYAVLKTEFVKWIESQKKSTFTKILFDNYEPHLRVQNTETRSDLNRILMRGQKQKTNTKSVKNDIFGNVVNKNTKILTIKVPQIGELPFFTNGPDVPCNKRYGMLGQDTFLLSETTQQEIANSITYIRQNKFEGKLWSTIDNLTSGKKAWLLAIPDKDIENSECASLLCDQDEKEEIKSILNKNEFETKAEKILTNFKAPKEDVKQQSIIIVAIADAGKKSRRVIYNEKFSTEAMVDAINSWLVALKNIPSSIMAKYKKAEFNPCVFPQDLAFLTKTKYNMSMSKPSVLYDGITSIDCLNLFMTNNTDLAKKALSKILNNHMVFLSVGPSVRMRDSNKHIAAMGVLLYKIGIVKENYMRDRPFVLGQLFKMYDLLHSKYCSVVRNGDHPQTYAGSLFTMQVMENPRKAYLSMCDRATYCMNWAKTNPKHAAWHTKQIERLCTILNGGLPATFNDEEKVQFYIGFFSEIEEELNKEKTEEMVTEGGIEVE